MLRHITVIAITINIVFSALNLNITSVLGWFTALIFAIYYWKLETYYEIQKT